jgi:predicted nucleic-acid-binding Zn-ribbon protein
MKTVMACAECDSHNLEESVMVLAMGQEGQESKEIVVVSCNDCGKQYQLSS